MSKFPVQPICQASGHSGAAVSGDLLTGCIELDTPLDESLTAKLLSQISIFGALLSVLMFVGLIVVLAVQFFASYDPERVRAVTALERSLEQLDRSGRLQGVSTKQAFLERVSAARRTHVAVHVHYISDLIRSLGRVLDGQEQELAKTIVRESLAANVDPLLVAAVIKRESTFNNLAVSHHGAQGLMQLLPKTGQYISTVNEFDWFGTRKLQDPSYNIKLGIAYLKHLQKLFDGNLENALIAYNWGPGNLNSAIKRGVNPPRSTVSYAKSILSTQEKWRREFENRLAAVRVMNPDSFVS